MPAEPNIITSMKPIGNLTAKDLVENGGKYVMVGERVFTSAQAPQMCAFLDHLRDDYAHSAVYHITTPNLTSMVAYGIPKEIPAGDR